MKSTNIRNRKGTSLLEVMFAAVILAVIILGAGAYVVHGSGTINIYRNKMTALELAMNRLEEIRAADYSSITPSILNYDRNYVSKQGTDWVVSGRDTHETTNISGMDMPITTTVQYVDKDPFDSVDTFDYLLVTVAINYRINTNETVSIQTNLGSYR